MLYLYTFGAALVIMAISLIGVLTVGGPGREWVERNLPYLVSFAAGVFGIVAFTLASESLELTGSALITLGALFGGAAMIHIFSAIMPEVHHHHESADPTDTHDPQSARRILASDAIHNVADGFLLAPAFALNPLFGAITALGILVHEAVQEMSEFFVLRQAGYSIKQALMRNFLVSSTILIGAIGGFFISKHEAIVGPLLGVGAGAFLYVVLHDLIPSSLHASRTERRILPYLIAGALGALLMFGINLFGHV